MLAPTLQFGQDELHIAYPTLFGAEGSIQCRRFVRRVFAFVEVRSISIEPDAGKAIIHYQVDEQARKPFLQKLADTLSGQSEGLDDQQLSYWTPGHALSLHRFGELVSQFEVAQTGPGRLLLRHSAIRRDAALRKRLEDAVKTLAGVKKATTTASTGRLWVVFEPERIDLAQVVRMAEIQLGTSGTALATLNMTPPRMALANTTLGLSLLGELAVPALLPICIGMLVVSNLGTLKDAARELGKGRIGMPVLYTGLLACSIATGQVIAHALMDWSFSFWARRSSKLMAENCRSMVETSLPIPTHTYLIRSETVDAVVTTESLQPGDRIRIEAPTAVPVDGRVVSGSGLVEQRAVSASSTMKRLTVGDEILAGSTLVAGKVEVEVTRIGLERQAARIAQSIFQTASQFSHDPQLHGHSRAIADRAVVPSLALAGAGYFVGGLLTVGAVLHQDHASGANLAVPMETLHDMGYALDRGVITQTPGALSRLGESGFVVLDDHPAWSVTRMELAELSSRLAESETDNLLKLAAGAALYLGDERAGALIDVCQAKGLIVRQPSLVTLERDHVVVRQGSHTLILRDDPKTSRKKMIRGLQVEIDGEQIAKLDFRLSPISRVASEVQHLHQLGMQVFLLSSRPASDTEKLAQTMGIGLHGGDFSPEEKIRFLQGMKKRGVLVTYIGNGQIAPELASEAHVTVSLGGTEALQHAHTDLVIPGDRLDGFAQTVNLTRTQKERIESACRKSWIPNALCVAGSYVGVLNGITSGIVANIGVGRVYRQSSSTLRNMQHPLNYKRLAS